MRVTRVQYDPDTMSCHVVLRLDDFAAVLHGNKVDHLQRAIQIAVP